MQPKITAVSPKIIKSNRLRVSQLDETRPEAAEVHRGKRMLMVQHDAGPVDKAGVAADHALIAVNHVAPIEHVICVGKADILDGVEPIEAAAPHVGVAQVMRRLCWRHHPFDPACGEVTAVMKIAAAFFLQEAA